jgi:hypothetical protein
MTGPSIKLPRLIPVKVALVLVVAALGYWTVSAAIRQFAPSPPPVPPAATALLRPRPLLIGPKAGVAGPIPPARLERALEGLEPYWEERRFGDLLHALRLWGPDAEFPRKPARAIAQGATPADSREMLSYFLDEAKFRRRFPTENPFVFFSSHGPATREGQSVPAANRHHDDFLALAGEVGLPRDTQLAWDGKKFSLEDLFGHSFQWFQPDQELEFTAMAYAYCLPPAKSWTNRFGQQFDFDQLANLLVRQHPSRGGCYGTHVPYSLAVLLAADEQEPILSPTARARVEDRLKAISRALVEVQSGAGWWDRKWIKERASAPPMEDELDEWVRSTSHHLEWIALVGPELRPPQENIDRAVRFLLEVLERAEPRMLSPAKRYAPYSHAGRALCLMAGKRYAAELMGASWVRRT